MKKLRIPRKVKRAIKINNNRGRWTLRTEKFMCRYWRWVEKTDSDINNF